MNAARLRAEFDWAPRHCLREALPGLVRWYDEHRDWAHAIRSGEYRQYYERQYGGSIT